MREHTHYDTLMVSRTATLEVIRAAYKALSASYHPDRRVDDPQAAKIMAAINLAYEVLSDPKSRREYDASLREAGPRKTSTADKKSEKPKEKKKAETNSAPNAKATEPSGNETANSLEFELGRFTRNAIWFVRSYPTFSVTIACILLVPLSLIPVARYLANVPLSVGTTGKPIAEAATNSHFKYESMEAAAKQYRDYLKKTGELKEFSDEDNPYIKAGAIPYFPLQAENVEKQMLDAGWEKYIPPRVDGPIRSDSQAGAELIEEDDPYINAGAIPYFPLQAEGPIKSEIHPSDELLDNAGSAILSLEAHAPTAGQGAGSKPTSYSRALREADPQTLESLREVDPIFETGVIIRKTLF